MPLTPDFAAIIHAPFGAIGIRTADGTISSVTFLRPDWPEKAPDNALARQAAEQIRQYLKHPDFKFDLPVTQNGTDFQQRVWREINAIPPGQTSSYGNIARKLLTPCHRIIRAGGVLGGFARQSNGDHFLPGIKRWLLEHEGIRLD